MKQIWLLLGLCLSMGLAGCGGSKADMKEDRLTVTMRPCGETQLVVRANAQYYLMAIEDSGPYQKFFRTLEQALFLQANAVQ